MNGGGSFTLAVASGKGGTGKTTVAVNLARSMGTRVTLLDCDVEEPNCSLFLHGGTVSTREVGIPVPEVDESLCDACGECSRFCAYKAIVSVGSAPLVFPGMCHGCGGCALVCPRGAISEKESRIGTVERSECGSVTLVTGRLDVGMAMAPPLVRAVKECSRAGEPCIIDCPPGTSCPMIAAIRGADMVLLVTEPTPFGLHDLGLAVNAVAEVGIPAGIVVNRTGPEGLDVGAFAKERGIPVLLEIPDDRRAAEAYSRGELLVDAIPEWKSLFELLRERTVAMAGGRMTREFRQGRDRRPE